MEKEAKKAARPEKKGDPSNVDRRKALKRIAILGMGMGVGSIFLLAPREARAGYEVSGDYTDSGGYGVSGDYTNSGGYGVSGDYTDSNQKQ
jgi:hypothetical protein